ncbi:hypothetical protein J5X98_23595 [Leptothermofonsia sichuanensis E412]|uniref:hypothetical protein n=1 Tax=Leptothermofonsia sichuanensis TaxID=2917832 RepID=UPI001CA5FA9B|nr:hypothetical protein [Leptothermofonsia sichuanensis]QZZ20216.1 hypothetical protein J5X98_23595 [Leptothermofonsia sichuanensis E412]
MASILVNDLRPAGSDLLLDQESFLTDLSDELTGDINGGLAFTITISPASAQIGAAAVGTFIASVGASYAIVKNWGK